MEDALEGLRGGGGGGGVRDAEALDEDALEDSDPERERSVGAGRTGVLARARLLRDSSSRRLLSPGGITPPAMRFCGGDRLASRLEGGVRVPPCGIGKGLGSLLFEP